MNPAGERKCWLIMKETKERGMRRRERQKTEQGLNAHVAEVFMHQRLVCFLDGRWSKKKSARRIFLISGELSDSLQLRINVIVRELQPRKDLRTELHLKRNTSALQIVGRRNESRARWWRSDYPRITATA